VSKRRSKLSSKHLSGSSRIWADSFARQIKVIRKPLNGIVNILYMGTILIPKRKKRKKKKNREAIKEARKKRRQRKKAAIQESILHKKELKQREEELERERTKLLSQDHPVLRDSASSPRSFEKFVRSVLTRKK
jgi:hypothetical protein